MGATLERAERIVHTRHERLGEATRAVASHALLDCDDALDVMTGHPTGAVAPAVLALGQHLDASGAGYTEFHAVERYWRHARLTKIFEGTRKIQLRIISDRMLGKPSRKGPARVRPVGRRTREVQRNTSG